MRRIQDARILLVDDNPDLLALVGSALQNAGYQPPCAAQSCAAARRAFAAAAPDFLVLDVNLPDGDGFTLFQELQARREVPALFLSARDADADRLFGLGLGADDYLTKPFLTQELLLRMEHILRRAYRAELAQGGALALGSRSVSLGDALVTAPGMEPLTLTATERALLQKLADNRGHIVTFDALCESVWGDGYYGYENALNVHIRHLREKLEDDPSHPVWLLTVRGLGYKLAGEARA